MFYSTFMKLSAGIGFLKIDMLAHCYGPVSPKSSNIVFSKLKEANFTQNESAKCAIFLLSTL